MDLNSSFVVCEDVAWALLKVSGFAVAWFVVWMFVGRYSLPLSRVKGFGKKAKIEIAESPAAVNGDGKPSSSSSRGSIGTVTPLLDFDYRDVEPSRVYKFSPRYNLTMGLQKTDIHSIIHIDRIYPQRLKARQDIIQQYPGALDCLDSGVKMVNELYEFLVLEYLPHRYPTVFCLDSVAGTVENLVTEEKLPLTAPTDRHETLRLLNRNVEEDFMMMLPSPDGDGYSLQAFVWAFPVGFDPQSKLGLKLRDLHGPVPAYKEKLARSMDRYFSKLEPGDIRCRFNFTVATNDQLCERGEYHLYEGQEPTETEFDVDSCQVRCERQTLFALPKSGGKILSVHLYLYPLQEIKDVGLGPEMIRAIDGFDHGNAPGFHRYKRALVWADRVKGFLTT